MRKLIGSIIFCIAGALLNMIVYWIFITIMGLPLYLDTIFTITVTLVCGPLWGVLTGALTNVHSFTVYGWEYYLFALCNVAAALVTWFFIRLFPLELNLSIKTSGAHSTGNELLITPASYSQRSFRSPSEVITAKPYYQAGSSRLSAVMDRFIVLTLLSFALCITMSILGGCISVFIGIVKTSAETVNPAAVPTMFNRNVPMLLKEIMSRIPINIIDRLLSSFAAFGAALGVRCLLQKAIKPSVWNQ